LGFDGEHSKVRASGTKLNARAKIPAAAVRPPRRR